MGWDGMGRAGSVAQKRRSRWKRIEKGEDNGEKGKEEQANGKKTYRTKAGKKKGRRREGGEDGVRGGYEERSSEDGWVVETRRDVCALSLSSPYQRGE